MAAATADYNSSDGTKTLAAGNTVKLADTYATAKGDAGKPTCTFEYSAWGECDRATKKQTHWQQVAVAACEQCGGNRVPQVQPAVPAPKVLHMGAVRYDMDRGELWRGAEQIRLTSTEAALMRIFAAQPGQAISRDRRSVPASEHTSWLMPSIRQPSPRKT